MSLGNLTAAAIIDQATRQAVDYPNKHLSKWKSKMIVIHPRTRITSQLLTKISVVKIAYRVESSLHRQQMENFNRKILIISSRANQIYLRASKVVACLHKQWATLIALEFHLNIDIFKIGSSRSLRM